MAILAREKELATAVFIFVNLGAAKEKHFLFWVKAHRATTLLELVWNIFKDGWEAGWIDRWMDGWTGGWKDEWMNGWMSGWMNGFNECTNDQANK